MTEFIRSTAKAIILCEGKILLNRSYTEQLGEFYALPGGGQHRFEALEDAVRRECLEETGLHVRVVRLAAVCEEIWTTPAVREEFPEYAHRMLHIFLCETEDGIPQETPAETDYGMIEAVWVPLETADTQQVEPVPLSHRIRDVVAGNTPLFLGSAFL